MFSSWFYDLSKRPNVPATGLHVSVSTQYFSQLFRTSGPSCPPMAYSVLSTTPTPAPLRREFISDILVHVFVSGLYRSTLQIFINSTCRIWYYWRYFIDSYMSFMLNEHRINTRDGNFLLTNSSIDGSFRHSHPPHIIIHRPRLLQLSCDELTSIQSMPMYLFLDHRLRHWSNLCSECHWKLSFSFET